MSSRTPFIQSHEAFAAVTVRARGPNAQRHALKVIPDPGT
jgi:hypothetical protein